jgi:signal transduction histidine kinase/ligand-binding sensor domain-containing protein
MRCVAISLSVLAILLHAVHARAQYQFDSWTTEQGLPQNSVQAILQARDGYLWLTTFDGLVRFDGVRFTVFNRANTPGIKTNRFTALYEDRDGVLWIGSEHGVLTRYDPSKSRFESFSLDGEGSGVIQGIAGDESGRLWIRRDDRILEWRGGQTHVVATGFANLLNIRSGIYRRSGFAGFWSQDDHGLRLFRRGEVTAAIGSNAPRTAVHAVAEDSRGDLWVAGDDGVARMTMKSGGRFAECAPGRSQFAFSPRLTLFCLDARAYLRMIRLDTGERITFGPAPEGLTANLAGAVFYEDREQNIWIGAGTHGLHRIRRQLITTYSQLEGLRDRNIYPVYQDRHGAIWLGAWLRTLSKIEGGRVTNYSVDDGLSGGLITALFEDRDGRLWIGAHPNYGVGGGLRIREEGHRTHSGSQRDRFVVPPGLDQHSSVKAIHQDRRGAMWFGTAERLVRVENGTQSSYTSRDGLAGNDVQTIVESADGTMWFGGARGLTRYTNSANTTNSANGTNSGKFTAFKEQDGLPSDHVRALYEDRDGVLWIGTYDGGMARFQNGRFTRYTTRDGLFDDGAFQILEDARGFLWMSSNRGIYRVNKREMNAFAEGRLQAITSVSYGKGEGMRSVEANGGSWPAGIKARDGTLWFPTQDGVVTIDPARLPAGAPPAPVRIEASRVDRRTVPIDAAIGLGPDNHDIEIDYTAVTFVNSARVRFKYQLVGLDRDWIDAGTRRTAYYSSVPPGRYTFMVMAANSDGAWNPEGRSLAVIVRPPFYRTWWFLTLAAALAVTIAAAAAYLAWRTRVRQLRVAHAVQQAFSRQLIASQEAERKRIAAELHDSIGQRLVIIKNLATLVTDTTMTAEQSRGRVGEISAEAHQAIGEVREIAQNLRPHHLDRLGLTKALQALLRKAAGASTITFTADVDLLDGLFPKDAEITVYRVVQEGVNNILKHSHATEAHVTVRRARSQVFLTMKDNGRGFSLSTVEEPAGRIGFGLYGIIERVTLLGGRADVRSVQGEGTTISVAFDLVGGV